MSVDARPDGTRSLIFFHLLKAICNFKNKRSNSTLIIVNAIMCVSSATLFLKAEHRWKRNTLV